jgi:hypothetical protein
MVKPPKERVMCNQKGWCNQIKELNACSSSFQQRPSKAFGLRQSPSLGQIGTALCQQKSV